MTLNKQLYHVINERGIKQIHLSRKTGLAPDVISKILKGNRKVTADEFLLICKALEINPNIFTIIPDSDSPIPAS